MTDSTRQLEKNMQRSFSYVKKDMMMLNEAISDIHDKIQHLSLNHATLLEQVEKLKKEVEKKSSAKISKTKTSKKAKTKKQKPVKKVVKETVTYS